MSHAPFPPLMTDDPPLGRCPKCGEELSSAYVLVEYEKDDGTTGIWAECPICDGVVSPQNNSQR
jgi:hypothetical protein